MLGHHAISEAPISALTDDVDDGIVFAFIKLTVNAINRVNSIIGKDTRYIATMDNVILDTGAMESRLWIRRTTSIEDADG